MQVELDQQVLKVQMEIMVLKVFQEMK
jgi:hypothetical protein